MELFKSTVTLLNTCEKLKVCMKHNVILGISQRAKANETCYCLCYCEHVKMRKQMRNGPDPRNEYGDKMRHFNEFFASFTFLCFRFMFLCNEMQHHSAYYSEHILYIQLFQESFH